MLRFIQVYMAQLYEPWIDALARITGEEHFFFAIGHQSHYAGVVDLF